MGCGASKGADVVRDLNLMSSVYLDRTDVTYHRIDFGILYYQLWGNCTFIGWCRRMREALAL
jgi:hypothetical protein